MCTLCFFLYSCWINRGEFAPPPAISLPPFHFGILHTYIRYVYIYIYLLAFFQFSWNRILLNVSCNTVYSISLDQFTATHYILSKKFLYDMPFAWLQVGNRCLFYRFLYHSHSQLTNIQSSNGRHWLKHSNTDWYEWYTHTHTTVWAGWMWCSKTVIRCSCDA